ECRGAQADLDGNAPQRTQRTAGELNGAAKTAFEAVDRAAAPCPPRPPLAIAQVTPPMVSSGPIESAATHGRNGCRPSPVVGGERGQRGGERGGIRDQSRRARLRRGARGRRAPALCSRRGATVRLRACRRPDLTTDRAGAAL